jgi:hypothetical protein
MAGLGGGGRRHGNAPRCLHLASLLPFFLSFSDTALSFYEFDWLDAKFCQTKIIASKIIGMPNCERCQSMVRNLCTYFV